MRGCPLVNMYFPVWFLNFLQQLFCSISGVNHHHHPVPTPATVEDSSAIASATTANSDSSPEISKERQAFVFFNSTPLFLSSKSEFSGRQSWARSRVSQNPKFKFFFASQTSFLGEKRGVGLSHPSLSSEVGCCWC